MCGVFGAVLPGGEPTDAASIAALGLFALQHRGQESAGLAVSDGEQLMLYKDLGMISTVLDERHLPSLRGQLAIAHCRYSTTGSTIWENAQPTYRLGPRRGLAIGHNGNLINTRELLAQLRGGRTRLPASTDTELLTALLADEPAADTVDALMRVLPRVHGAYSLVVLDERRVIGVRDPFGFRPLVLGRLPRTAVTGEDDGFWSGDDAEVGWCLSSETAALDIVGAEYVRDVQPGEMVILEPGEAPRSVRFAEATPALCVFELIYFARPDSYMEGRNLYEARRRMGMQLALEHPIDADLVMPVPDTGAPAAAGFAEASGLPYREGMYRNRYAGRTFIQPSAGLRHRGVTIKLNPLREVVNGKRLVVVDDSIVRGTTTKRIVDLLRKAGATEVHVRISAPPIYHPCFYGIDTQIETELIASTHTEPEIREFIGADSLGYLTIRGVLAALDLPYERFCFACFDGHYPDPVPYDAKSRKFMLEEPVAGLVGVSPVKGDAARDAYRAAGVDVAAGERAVDLMRGHVESTRRPEVVGGIGGFGGAIAIPAGYREPLLVASTDGAGTKTGVAAALGRFDTIGIDLVAMSANDVVCSGAEPLAFLDYIAVGRIEPALVAELVGSVAAGCRDAGCALVGGETAEHPGLMEVDAFDLSGCCIGVVERADVIDGSAVLAGDAIVGLAASGLHANGFSLVRALIARWDLDLAEPYQARLRRSLGDAETDRAMAAAPNEAMATLGEILLTSTRMYVRPVLAVRAAVRAAGSDLHGIAHITGGGLPGNVPRVIPHGLSARLDPGRWRMPSVMRLFGALGGLDDVELRATFNGGIGMVLVVPPDAVATAIAAAEASGIAAAVIGEVVDSATIGGARYVEGPLEALG